MKHTTDPEIDEEELTDEDFEEIALQQRINNYEYMLEGYGDR